MYFFYGKFHDMQVYFQIFFFFFFGLFLIGREEKKPQKHVLTDNACIFEIKTTPDIM